MSPTTPTNFHRCIIEGIVLESSQLGLLTALLKTSRCYRVVDVAQPNTQISLLPFPSLYHYRARKELCDCIPHYQLCAWPCANLVIFACTVHVCTRKDVLIMS